MNRRARLESGIPVLTMAYNHHCNISHVSKGKNKKNRCEFEQFYRVFTDFPKTPSY